MTIPQSRYVSVTNVLSETRGVERRDLSGLVFTRSRLAPFGYLVEVGSAEDARRFFGSASREYGFARAYFAAEGYGGKRPTRLAYTRYARGEALTPVMMSQSCSVRMSDFRSPPGGHTTVIMKTTTDEAVIVLSPSREVVTVGNTETLYDGLAQCVCLNDVCAVFNRAVASSNKQWARGCSMSFENGRFFLRFANGTDGELLPWPQTPLAEAFGMTEERCVIVSDAGGDASAVGAISRIAGTCDNFGSFCFLDGEDDAVAWSGTGSQRFWAQRAADAKAVDAWLAAEGHRFLFVVGFGVGGKEMAQEAGLGCSSHVVVFDPDRYGFEEAEAMGILATIDYSSSNEAEYSWMFRSNGFLTPLDIGEDEAALLSAANVNYYGRTQEVGADRAFYQPGKNADGTDTSAYCAEMWLKDAIATKVMDRLLKAEKVDWAENGADIIGDDIATVVDEAVENGTITVPDALIPAQRLYVIQTFGFQDAAADEVEKDGYCLSVFLGDGGEAKYILLYHRNGNFRKIEGTHVA